MVTSCGTTTTTSGPGMGLATPSSDTLVSETGSKSDTPRENRNRADCTVADEAVGG